MVSERLRKWAPKVRTGCLTCKKRKKRCDETRPVCERCRVGGYICDGYGPQLTETNTIQTDHLLVKAEPGSTMFQTVNVPIDEETCDALSTDLLTGAHLNCIYFASDQRCTQFFIARVAPVLSTTKQWSTFWEDTIPLTSLNDTPVHHAMLALSSTYECKFFKYFDSDKTTERQISQAIKASMSMPIPINNLLILCRLLAAVSQSAEDWKTATMHLQHGWRILLEGGRSRQIHPALLRLLGPTFLSASTHAFEPGKVTPSFAIPYRESLIKLDRMRSSFAVRLSALNWKTIKSFDINTSILLAWSNMSRALCALVCKNFSPVEFGVEPGTTPIAIIASQLFAQGKIVDADNLHAETYSLLEELTVFSTKLHQDAILANELARKLRCLTESFLVYAFILDKSADVGMFWAKPRKTDCDIDVHLLRHKINKSIEQPESFNGQFAAMLQSERLNHEVYLERICPYRSGFLPGFRELR